LKIFWGCKRAAVSVAFLFFLLLRLEIILYMGSLVW
jgi:hypothetical protein